MAYIGTKPQIATALADNIVTADKIASGAVTDPKIAAMAATKLTGTVPDANAPSGSVIQVVSSAKTDTQSTASTSYVDITGLSVTITPSSSSNKILIIFDVKLGADDTEYGYTRLVRNSTSIYSNSTYDNTSTNYVTSGDAEGKYSTYQNGGVFLDSPSTTSSITYTVQFRCSRGEAVFVNRSQNFNSEARGGASSITVMEIAA